MVVENKESSASRLPPPEPVDASAYLREALAQGQVYFKAQAARIKATIRSAILLGILGIAVVLTGLTVVIVSVTLFCVGAADAIAALLGGRQWAGDLITGGVVLTALFVGTWLTMKMLTNSARRRTIASFEKQRRAHP